MLERPHGRNEALINRTMWKHLVVQAAYQIAVLFLVIYGGPGHVAAYKLSTPCATYGNVDAHVRLPDWGIRQLAPIFIARAYLPLQQRFSG